MDIQPNSLEAVIFFAAYICAQDNKIAKVELTKILESSKIINSIKAASFDSDDTQSLSDKVQAITSLALKKKLFLQKKISDSEKDYIKSLLTDSELIQLALRAGRISASIDGFHQNENHKFIFWLKEWAEII